MASKVDSKKSIQNDLQSYVQARQQLEAQLQENKIVKEEFDTLDDDSKVFKLIGPVLVPQDKEEARLNVNKRLEFIDKEIKRVQDQIIEAQKKLQAPNPS